MRNAGLLPKLLFAIAVLCVPVLSAQEAPGPATTRVKESEQRLGIYPLGEQTFTVTTRSQTLSPSANEKFATTISALEILDADGNVAYREDFPVSIVDRRFMQTLAVSASLLQGASGRALLLRFIQDNASGASESWQMFGLVNAKLARYKAPLPLGQGGMAVNGVLTGVMVHGGIGVVPLASAAEALDFRVWAGSLYVGVPVRMDWEHGQWSEGEQCFANEGGTLHPTGCNLQVAPIRQRVTEGAAVTLYGQPEENAYNAQRVMVHGNSVLEFPAVRALVHWQNSGDRFTCSFDELWLRVRIDGSEGWVHSATDFAALGLTSSNPAR